MFALNFWVGGDSIHTAVDVTLLLQTIVHAKRGNILSLHPGAIFTSKQR